MSTAKNPGGLSRTLITVPATGYTPLPVPDFSSPNAEISYAFEADGTATMQLVRTTSETSLYEILAATFTPVGPFKAASENCPKFLYNPTGAPATITVVITRTR